MIKNKSIIVKLDTNEGCNCNSIKDIQLAIKENRDIVTSLTYAIDNTYILKGITILHEQNMYGYDYKVIFENIVRIEK